MLGKYTTAKVMKKRNVKRIDIGVLSLKEAGKKLEEIKYLIRHRKPKPIKPKWWW